MQKSLFRPLLSSMQRAKRPFMTLAATACLSITPLYAATIPDGAMDNAPGSWTKEANTALHKDSAVKHGGNASLRVDGLSDGEAKAVLTFPIPEGKPFTFSGALKTKGLTGGALGVMAMVNTRPVGGWQHISNVQSDKDWQTFSKAINVPAGANRAMIILMLKGKGSAWLDELSGNSAVSEAGESATAGLPQEDLAKYNGPVPVIEEIGLIKPTMLMVQIYEMKRKYAKLVPYKKQAGDTIKNKKVRQADGEIMERELIRNGKAVGRIVGPDSNLHLAIGKNYTYGKPLHRNKALTPDTWTLTSTNGDLKPSSVALKQKPYGRAGDQTRRNWYVLTFDKPLTVGSQYTLDVGQYDLAQAFTFNPKAMRSEAVHISHVGYRPDDPSKWGYLSYWSGTGGAVAYSAGKPFALLDAQSGAEVFSGKTTLRMSKDTKSYGTHAKGRNYALSDVFVCDFSAFNTPGRYVLYVDGVGTSFPFNINREAWTEAVKNSLRGFFHQRASQEWKQPWADWDQPRAFHPDNGEDYWEMSMSKIDIKKKTGKRAEDAMDKGLFEKWKTGKKVKNAWGGYYDAGDFDRHTAHLICSRNMLELMELFPGYYASMKTPIPEANNDLPDLFDEALWAIDFYKRIQREDGAIYGGIETNGHPKPGEPAFLDSLRRYVFAPDPVSSWRYAASASRAAYVFKQLGKQKAADEYLTSAVRAMTWAEKEYLGKRDYFDSDWQAKDKRNLAAIAIYRMNEDPAMMSVFMDSCIFKQGPTVNQWGTGIQEEAAFLYARLPEGKTDAAVRSHAIKGIEATARKQMTYSDGIPFAWTGPKGDPGFPLILSINAAPQGISLCRAYSLTKNKQYLDYAVRTTHNSVGANPQNMTFTTRLGHRSPEFPLQCSKYYMFKDKPYSGFTVYGLFQMGKTPSWVEQWFVTKHVTAPTTLSQWPVAESYWDVESWPMVTENTVQQSMAPAIYVWGYLAGRK